MNIYLLSIPLGNTLYKPNGITLVVFTASSEHYRFFSFHYFPSLQGCSSELRQRIRRKRCGRPPQRGDSAFMSSLRLIFKAVQPFFRPKLGTGESFRFWADEWLGNGRISQSFPRMFALALVIICNLNMIKHDY